MSIIKTIPNSASVDGFLQAGADTQKREDGQKLLEMFTRLTGELPKIWGSSIIGFGQYHYKSERSGQEGEWLLIGFSPRKQNLTLYFMTGFDDYTDLLNKLGKHKTSKGCLYINKLADVDLGVLEELIKTSYEDMKRMHPAN